MTGLPGGADLKSQGGKAGCDPSYGVGKSRMLGVFCTFDDGDEGHDTFAFWQASGYTRLLQMTGVLSARYRTSQRSFAQDCAC